MGGVDVIEVTPGRRHIIRRPRLTRLLDESGARIILLTAPAGYGKTTLARQWLEERRHGWYRGGPASADVAALAVGLAEAAADVLPAVDKRIRDRLRATSHPERETDVLAEILAEDLAQWPEDAWLAFDDYQFAIESEASERFVDKVLTDSAVQMLITSRERPRWATARRILYGEILEIDGRALAMSRDEAVEVLSAETRDASALLARAQGWPAVVGLAAVTGLSVPGDQLPAPLYDYFAEELYQREEPSFRWALCCSLFRRLSTEVSRRISSATSGGRSSSGPHASGRSPPNQKASSVCTRSLERFFRRSSASIQATDENRP